MSASTGSTVAVLVGLLVALGLTMLGVAVWLVRATRSDPKALGPLEVMGDRRFRKRDVDRRREDLDTARPPGAPPPAPVVAIDSAESDMASEPVEEEGANGEPADATSAANDEPSTQDSAVSAQSSEEQEPVTESESAADSPD
jgi:hypothetical protein